MAFAALSHGLTDSARLIMHHAAADVCLLCILLRTSKASSQALPPAREPRAVEAAATSSVCDDHGAHLAVVKAAVHLLLHAQGALVPKSAQCQKNEAAVRDHCNPVLRPAPACNKRQLLLRCQFCISECPVELLLLTRE